MRARARERERERERERREREERETWRTRAERMREKGKEKEKEKEKGAQRRRRLQSSKGGTNAKEDRRRRSEEVGGFAVEQAVRRAAIRSTNRPEALRSTGASEIEWNRTRLKGDRTREERKKRPKLYGPHLRGETVRGFEKG